MKRTIQTVGVVLVLLALGACVAGSAESQQSASGGALSQLFLGLWHGIIAPVTLIVELVNHFFPHLVPWSAKFYESRGTTFIYDLGFYFGLIGSPLIASSRWSARR
jgi:hypothetical protein